MLMVCHHLDPAIAEDVAFAESRIRRETIAAEDILHDLGAFSMISSDSQAMGRVGEVIMRTWQTAHKMKHAARRAAAGQSRRNDNFRVKRYIAKYTINPAHHARHRARSRLARSRQAGRSGAVEAGVLRREAVADPEGRHDRRRAPWATRMRRSRRRSRCTTGRCSARSASALRATVGDLRLAGCAGTRTSGASSACTSALVAVYGHARARRRRHAPERLHAATSKSIRRPTKCAPTASC